MSSLQAPERPISARRPAATASAADAQAAAPIAVLIAAPSLDAGAAGAGALELARVLTSAGHRAVVVARPGRLVADLAAAGAAFVALDLSGNNPIRMLRNAEALTRIARAHNCDAIHALGRGPAWSAWAAARMRGIPFITSWYKGFREQNFFKHFYNGVMARGDRVVALSEQIAQLVHDRYGTPWERIDVLPSSIDLARFDPATVTPERIEAMRTVWGVKPETKVILITGRILRRKGHDVAVRAARRLKDMGVADFLFVFVGEDGGHTRYTGELWDLVLASETVDVVRMAAPVYDMPAAYAVASVAVSAAVQPEGLQRSILEAQAMARPVIVSDLGAGPDVVLTAPTTPDHHITGLRFAAGDDAALTAALLKLFAMPDAARRAIGLRGQEWVRGHFNARLVAEQTLKFYSEVACAPDKAPALVPQPDKI